MLLKLSMLVVAGSTMAFHDKYNACSTAPASGDISLIFLNLTDLFYSISAQVPQVGHAQR